MVDNDGIVNVTVVAEAAQGLQEIVVLVNDNSVEPKLTFAPGEIVTRTQQTLAIPFPGEGTYNLKVQAKDASGAAATTADPVSFTLECIKHQPSHSNAETLTTADTWALGSEVLVFSGTAADSVGLAWVKIRAGDGPFKPVKLLTGNQWEAAIVIPDSQTTTGVDVTVRARDYAGRITEVSNVQSVDLSSVSPPDTVISPTVPSSISVNSITVGFEGIDGSNEAAVFACRLDEGQFTACGNPQTFSDLSNGAHTLAVRSIDAQGFVDPTPAIAKWTVSVAELAQPSTLLSSLPIRPSAGRRPSPLIAMPAPLASSVRWMAASTRHAAAEYPTLD